MKCRRWHNDSTGALSQEQNANFVDNDAENANVNMIKCAQAHPTKFTNMSLKFSYCDQF